MPVNVPEVVTIFEDDKTAVVKVIGWFNALTSVNTKIQSNTFIGANTSAGINCIMSISNFLYSTSFGGGNGKVSVEFVSTVNVNTRSLIVGRFNDGEIQKYVTNSANTPTGDLNINTELAGSNDSFTIVLTLTKENMGIPGNAARYGAGAWANAFTWQ